jgi:hypothetical protein
VLAVKLLEVAWLCVLEKPVLALEARCPAVVAQLVVAAMWFFRPEMVAVWQFVVAAAAKAPVAALALHLLRPLLARVVT